VPRTAGLDLAAAGIKTDARGYVAVDARLRTNVKNIYACGDVTGQFAQSGLTGYHLSTENDLYGQHP